MKIAELLKKKSRDVVTVRPSTSIATAVDRLRLERIGCLVISKDGEHLAGIVAVRDIVYALAEHEATIRELPGFSVLDEPISRIMTRNVKTCTPEDTLKEVMEMMTRHHVLHVPVLEKGALCGIVSIDDVVKYAVQQMDMERDVLRDTVVRLQTAREVTS